jgi:hypothetical protein
MKNYENAAYESLRKIKEKHEIEVIKQNKIML